MANIVRRGGEPQQPTTMQRGAEWDPLRVMREMLRFDPFAELAPLIGERMQFLPQFEVIERPDAYVFKADVPGVREDDLDIQIAGNRLVISGKREAEERKDDERFFALERSYGSFTRTFTLPDGVDDQHVQAELKHGVLTLIAPKKPEMQPRKVELKGVKPQGGGKA